MARSQGTGDEKVVHLGSPRLATSGGGPHDPGMEARVAKLEAHIEHIQGDLAEIKSDIREIKRDARGIFACCSAPSSRRRSASPELWREASTGSVAEGRDLRGSPLGQGTRQGFDSWSYNRR